MNHSHKNWSAQLSGIKDRLAQNWGHRIQSFPAWNRRSVLESWQNLDPQKIIQWSTGAFQRGGTRFYGTLAAISLSTFFFADVTALLLEQYIPEIPVSRSNRFGTSTSQIKTIGNYSTVFSRNLFNSQGLIPGDEGSQLANNDPGGVPVRSTLPLNLVGTLIMNNEIRSIATIEDKISSSVYPMRIEDEIPNKLRVVKIEPRRVIFINNASNRREYIELPEDANHPSAPVTSSLRPSASAATGAGIEKVAATQYNISRTEVDKALADFNNILTQARAVPNFENGAASGYKLFQIVPGSIYDKLGLQNGDVISGLNGTPINDPAKAFEMLSDLKTSSHLELQVKKDGKIQNYTYDIH
jgi:general secretion pathway protein C